MIHFFWLVVWTLILYWAHRIGHILPKIKDIHFHHHHYISSNNKTGWCWSNLIFFQDNWFCTWDVYITEVIPTVIFCWMTGEWWIFGFFYVWSAFIQERIEHNPNFNVYPFLTSGKWHLKHHKTGNCNYGDLTPLWDIVFQTHTAY